MTYRIGGHEYHKGALIAEGGFAHVYHLDSPTNPTDRYALKVFKDGSDPLNKAVELMHAKRGLLVPVVIVGDELIMPLGQELDPTVLTKAQKVQVMEEIHRQQLELIRQGFIYTDIKSHNILVMPDGSIQLGDYSGLCPIGGGYQCINTVGLPEQDFVLHPTIRTEAEAIAAAKYYSTALLVELLGRIPVAMGHSQVTDMPPAVREGANRLVRKWLEKQGYDSGGLSMNPQER